MCNAGDNAGLSGVRLDDAPVVSRHPRQAGGFGRPLRQGVAGAVGWGVVNYLAPEPSPALSLTTIDRKRTAALGLERPNVATTPYG